MMVLRKMLEVATTLWDKATAWLLIGAIFFAMRSCEYLETNIAEEKRRTRILRLRNVVFKKDGRIVPHSSPVLASADLVIVTYEYMKNDRRDVQIHMFATSCVVLNPVVAWAKTVSRIWTYPGTTADTKVCTFQLQNEKLILLKSADVRDKLRSIISLIGEDVLGFKASEIGLHSIRSGGAMAMFLSGTPTIIIMRVGRWSSEAFLEYIREQVESFTVGVSENMLAYEFYFNLNRNSLNSTTTETSTAINIENGPETVPFQVNFSTMALHDDSANLMRNGRTE